MEFVVFFRASNVGGYRTFKPSSLAKELPDVKSFGAAGTLVASAAASEKWLREQITKKLSFEPELMIFPSKEILDLVTSEPFSRAPADVKCFVSAMERAPNKTPALPIERPIGKDWEVRLIQIKGRFALSLWRHRNARAILYPNQVVERTLDTKATTRGWNTILSINKLLTEK
jgi:uncharacterized protein (DUF1697 family)